MSMTHRLFGEADPEFALERADQELGFLAFALCQQGLDDADFATLALLLRDGPGGKGCQSQCDVGCRVGLIAFLCDFGYPALRVSRSETCVIRA